MKKFNVGKRVCIVVMFCVAAAIASPAQTLTTLVSFDGTNGSAPAASLIQASDGNLYGTTEYGGPISGCEGGFNPCGTVFRITLSGTLTTLHTFVYSDGAFPVSPVVQGTDGNFYGTNQGEGDSGGSGAIFKMTPSGTVTVLSSTNSPAGLVQGRDGNFYGTTPRTYTDGTVFKITPGGMLTTLHTFDGTDGNNPQAGLIQATDGNFYGTTASGGTSSNCGYGCGTVFKMTPSGSLTTLHSFSVSDGFNVMAGLVQGSDGNFYGVTMSGGAQNAGVAFKITSSGTFTALHTFNGTDGYNPGAALIQASDGNFYGTARSGGANGQGTIFAMTPSGSLTTLYSFCPQSGCADGATPVGGVIQASDGNFYGTTIAGGNNSSGTVFKLTPLVFTTTALVTTPNPSYVGEAVTITATVSPAGPPAPTGTVSFTSNGTAISGCTAVPLGSSLTAVCVTSTLAVGTDAIVATYSGDSNYGPSSGMLTQIVNPVPVAVQFVPLTPCRVVDTRNPNGPFGGPTIGALSSRAFPLGQSGNPCNIPANAVAYSLNVTAVPQTTLGYLTIWPTGEGQPVVSTMNSLDGRVKANAAIIPAGTPSGSVSVYVTNTTNVVLDIDGYFAPVSGQTLAFYPLTPCRVADTRDGTKPSGLGPPQLSAGTPRSFPVLASPCIPTGVNPQAYSFNFTVVPIQQHPVGYLSVWPTGQDQPVVSTLNDQRGTIVANAAIVPAGTSGAISVYATDGTQLAIDIDGYFAAAGQGGLSLYALTPCRVLDTRHIGTGQPFTGEFTVDVRGSFCAPPSTAQAYVFNATVVPVGSLGYLALWPDGQMQPVVSTLNATDGAITSNMAIVPAGTNGKIDAFANNGVTQLLLDISSYFAP